MFDILSQDIKYLKGIGPLRAKVLYSDMSIRTIRDLLETYPYRYIDRSRTYKICELREGMSFVQIRGRIISFQAEGSGRKKHLKALFSDGQGIMELVWFRGISYIEKQYKPGVEYVAFGSPQVFGSRWSMAHPELEKPDSVQASVAFYPCYHTSGDMKRARITSKQMVDFVATALAALRVPLPETLPPYIVERKKLCSRDEAIRYIHRPRNYEQIAAAERRLKFEELFYIQLGILDYARERQERSAGQCFTRIGSLFNSFYQYHLDFALTNAQKRVLREIRADVGSGKQMNRLLQGDVGSGKTIVALMAMLMALDNNRQVCLMAPTEILAEQHYASITEQLDGMPVRVDLLTSTIKGRRRNDTLSALASGDVNILIGTHAVIEDNVVFAQLGLVVIDEQHRFGVAQRAKLWLKSAAPPHVLVMTATPIPRTLAMTVYGDLNVSVLDELPPGRKPVLTRHVSAGRRVALYQKLESEISNGHQVYYVFPLIKENEKMDLRDLENGFEALKKIFPNRRLAYVHGKMSPTEKSEVMERFANGSVDILVATTVIEVGVNVPNATVMVVEEAQRFGLSQLHQLRGRVGRNAEQAYCFLVTPEKMAENTRKRIEIMVETNDGFRISEEDMRMRGPGDLQGTLQSGMPFDLRIANLATDGRILEEARALAHEVLESDPQHNRSYNDILWRQLSRTRKHEINWSEIS
jgi:ATP-dependent DNA helicase RecG